VNKLNKNIEVINKNLWAVKFSFLPFISEIDYKPDPDIPAYEEFGRATNDGILILNKDYAGFNILKEHIPKVMKKKDKQLKKEIKASQALKNKTDWQNVYYAMLQIEAERRKKEKGMKYWN
jgi:hypothetical protein